ncbi:MULTISPECIES: zf-HC2 domain-containing protein [Paenibacillus]|uniref:Anti-sigma-W factor RsiW n=1 Tax=Paenibacillus baimaensis TaxID=2982185 RepID=A0ABT2UGT8_9BACL|nr:MULTISPECIES: zf-HC2 domain-containing protein [unclassified Paenibacillus]MCU6793810.1 zf-HC2 domain-containing protein [Paenibacillus sp. WQ 127069]OME99067.1 anti-sigma factor [Paenibacillus sp. FSL H7-0331]
MDCKEALPLIHEYMDGSLKGSEALQLKKHLLTCPTCKMRLQQLERVEALIQSWPRVEASAGLTERIMAALPPMKQRSLWRQWIRNHPGISVAAVFVLVMTGSFMSMWNENSELIVKGTDLQSVVIQGNTVYVPVGKKVAGNIMVENGKLQVDGDIEGDIVVVQGSVILASTAHISGQITQIDEAFGWLWFKMNGLASKISQVK